MSGWIGVDLDGTLAHYDGWKGIDHVGEPIAPMMKRVRRWLSAGTTVKIFTARASCAEPERSQVIAAIHAWLRSHNLPDLEVTCVKDFGMVELWDDRAVQVVPNKGHRADGRT
jgi:hypothetical protein